jgi:hypothetical protein
MAVSRLRQRAAGILLMAMIVLPYYLNKHQGARIARWLGRDA